MPDEPSRGRRVPWLAAGLALLLLTAIAVAVAVGDRGDQGPAVTSPADVPATESSTPPRRSARTLIAEPRANGGWPGPNGLSGVNGDPVFDTAHVQQFCAARGRDCKVTQTYTDRTSYQSMTMSTSWTFGFFQDFDGMLVISQGLVPDGGEQDLAGCAAGEFDQYWRAFGTLMVRHGRGDSVLRLGWEMNESTMPWRGTDTDAYIQCYRHAADNIRATDPAVVLDWTINAHGTPAGICGGLSTDCYPGDDYVDIIGIDNYDHYPWSPSKADFDRTAAEPEGLTWLYEFARKHGKLFSVGEWGVTSTGDAKRENPNFVAWMHAWFAAHAANLAYEAYFSDCGAGGVQSSLFRSDAGCVQNPRSAAAYRTLFGS
jgi:glycosyl hydrolase family 26